MPRRCRLRHLLKGIHALKGYAREIGDGYQERRPTLRRVRAFDELHYVVLYVNAPRELAERIAYEFLSEMQDGELPDGWRETWPEIRECGSAS